MRPKLADVGGLELLGYSGKPEGLDGIRHPWYPHDKRR